MLVRVVSLRHVRGDKPLDLEITDEGRPVPTHPHQLTDQIAGSFLRRDDSCPILRRVHPIKSGAVAIVLRKGTIVQRTTKETRVIFLPLLWPPVWRLVAPR